MALSNSEKQARYRERHFGADGERVRLILNASTRAQMVRLARYKGYTITSLVGQLVKSADRRVTDRLTGKALKTYYGGD